MITQYNILICPFNMGGCVVRNPLIVIQEKMLCGVPIVHNGFNIGNVVLDSVRVGSDGFYGDIRIADSYADVPLEFKNLSWYGMPCDEDGWVVESISQIAVQQKTQRRRR